MKNNRGKKEVALVASGIILGATLAAPVAGAAHGLHDLQRPR